MLEALSLGLCHHFLCVSLQTTETGSVMSGSAFESYGGMSKAKKWKESVRIRFPDGSKKQVKHCQGNSRSCVTYSPQVGSWMRKRAAARAELSAPVPVKPLQPGDQDLLEAKTEVVPELSDPTRWVRSLSLYR